MPNHASRYHRLRRLLLLIALIGFLGATACSTLPREHWWQFWRKKPASAQSIYNPDQVTVPPPPDSPGAGRTGAVLSPGGMPAPPGEVTDTDPLRRPPAGTVTALRTIFFEYNSDSITPESKSILDSNAEWLKANPTLEISIEGHCDERGTTEYNISLGERRARNVKAYMMGRGVEGGRLHTATFGKERPLDPGHDESSWSKNRRAQFLVY